MDLQLKGKRALVTGSSSGIGAAIAKTLAQEGASVVIQGRKQVEAERVAQEIIANGASSVVAIGDLTKNEDATHVVEAAPSTTSYSATKAANINMTVSLTKELAGTGITVNTVSPRPVVTEGWNEFALDIAAKQGWGNDLEVIKQKMLETVFNLPSGRLGQPEDVANLVAFVASRLSGYINGANLRVDGGQTSTVN